ncbi:MAG: hypothetical protein ABEJ89_05225 [Haloarculaceae archaeon]
MTTDPAGESTPVSEDASADAGERTDAGDARDVIVPLRVYKTVTVFSTLFAVVGVLAGFVLLDQATHRAQLPLSKVDPVLGIAGIGLIVLAAATYAFSTRFRTAEMGKSKDESDEPSDNG